MSPKVFIISGPSGAGEDSVVKGIKEKLDVAKPVSTTTRSMRPGEIEGKNYYFVSEEEFKRKIASDEFFEWTEEDRGKLYGITKEEINRVVKTGKIVILKIEYHGVITVKKLLPEAKAILITAPLDVIEKRLRSRENDGGEEFIQARLEYAKGWGENKDIFDFEVENIEGELDKTIEKVINIIQP